MKRYLTKTIDSFKRHGADLPAAGKARLKEIDVALTEVTTKFSENVLDSTNAYELLMTDESSWRDCLRRRWRRRGRRPNPRARPGWRFTLQGPSYMALMTYLDDAAIRQQVWQAYNTRATAEPHDNRAAAREDSGIAPGEGPPAGIPRFRGPGAGRPHGPHRRHGAEVSWTICASAPSRASAKRTPRWKHSRARKLEPWDVGYWAEKQRAALYDFDEEALRPYFSLENVVNGMFEIFGRIFGIRVEEETGVPVWDPAVKCYAIRDAASGVASGIVLQRLVSARKQARRGMDGFPAHRESHR